ncbi:hypothetical protein ABF87_04915 [Nitrosomonas sp. JL21]|nr:hypothetical protein [Nitrosomonas sp. JL21]
MREANDEIDIENMGATTAPIHANVIHGSCTWYSKCKTAVWKCIKRQLQNQFIHEDFYHRHR